MSASTTTQPAGAIHPAPEDAGESVINTLLLAFAFDPGVRWMYPDPTEYRECFDRFVQAFAGKAFGHGTALTTEGMRGVAMWLPPGVHPDEEALVPLIENTVAPDRQPEAFALFEQMDQFVPDEPHWYLPLLGVDPAHQGCGLGSRLLAHITGICDRDQLPAYLEATCPRNAALYERHGFEAIGSIQTRTSPVITPMLRRPR